MAVLTFLLVQFSVLAYALVGGVFLAFSDFIMRSLAHTRGVGGAEAMQAINREVFRWVFMTLFLGMGIVSLVNVVVGAFMLPALAGMLIMASGLIYLIGCLAVTIVFNVPMNEALAGMDASKEQSRQYWTQTYLPRWTFWNTVRTAACIVSASILVFGVLSMK